MNLIKMIFTGTDSAPRLTSCGDERGASLLETLLAIGLVAAMAPFAYNRVLDVSRDIADVAAARRIHNWKEAAKGFIRANQMDWEDDAIFELSERDLVAIRAPDEGKQAIFPYAAFIEKFSHAGGTTIEAYILFPGEFDGIRMHRIAHHLGADAAVAGDAQIAFSASGGWSIESDILEENDIVFRVSVNMPIDDSYAFMHRVDTGDERLNTMERDLSMSRNDIVHAGAVNAGLLDSKMVGAWFAGGGAFSADEAVFPQGANVDGGGVSFAAVRVVGDIIGFRNIHAGIFAGGGGALNWSAQGNIVADRVNIAEAVHVGRNMTVRSPNVRTVSGFLGISVHSLATPFVSTEELRFADGFGLSISNELSASFTDGPLRLGNWAFPRTPAPRFADLVLTQGGAVKGGVPTGFENIMSRNWKALRPRE
ncbi:MAG: hypothetical protein FWE17_01770 [Alphaproteobacteria bacterium]|nr:hypothetical protein [Alphaproteobacteria bacterium]